MSHTYNNKNTPGGRRRLPSNKRECTIDISLGSRPVNTNAYQEERRQSIAQLRVAERLQEEQQSVKTQTAYEKVEEQIKMSSPEERKQLLDVYNSVKTQE